MCASTLWSAPPAVRLLVSGMHIIGQIPQFIDTNERNIDQHHRQYAATETGHAYPRHDPSGSQPLKQGMKSQRALPQAGYVEVGKRQKQY